jgi:hypothetical protein
MSSINRFATTDARITRRKTEELTAEAHADKNIHHGGTESTEKRLTTEGQRCDAEMGRDGDTAKKAKKI